MAGAPSAMPPRLRRAALTAHLIASVGWFGAVVAFLSIALAGLTGRDTQTLRGLLLAMELMTWYAIVPLAGATLLTGVIQSLGTPWGLFRHYWIVCKLVVSVLVTVLLLDYTRTVGTLASAAADATVSGADLRGMALSPVLHASLALLVLIVPTVLSVVKPPGLTRYGQRRLGATAPAGR